MSISFSPTSALDATLIGLAPSPGLLASGPPTPPPEPPPTTPPPTPASALDGTGFPGSATTTTDAVLVTSPGAVQPPPFASDVPNLDPSTLFAIIEETQSVDIPAVLASTTPPTLGSGSSLTEQLAAIAFGQLAAEAVAPLPGNSAAGSATALQEAAFADAIVETLDDVDVETGPTSAFSPPTEAQSIAAAVFDTSVA